MEVTPELVAAVVAEFETSGSVGAASRVAGCSHSLARRLLVAAGLFPAEPQPLGKPVPGQSSTPWSRPGFITAWLPGRSALLP